MPVMLRSILVIVSLLTAIWIIYKIRQNRVKQEDAVFWIFYAIILAILGLFPGLSFYMAHFLGIQSSSNFVFLAIIALLLEKLLSISIQVSVLENKVEEMTAEIALRCKNLEDGQKKEETGDKDETTESIHNSNDAE